MKIENVAVISLEDYAEYQELKKSKKEIDFSRLKVGSVVMIRYTGDQVSSECNSNFPCTILSIDDGFIVGRSGDFAKVNRKYTLNVIQEGYKISSFVQDDSHRYITEVISY